MLSTAATSSVRRRPAGVSSYTHDKTSAIGKPTMATSATSETTQSGNRSAGANTLVTCTAIQATIAYATPTRYTLRRLSSLRKDNSTPPPLSKWRSSASVPRPPPLSTGQRARSLMALQRATAHPAEGTLMRQNSRQGCSHEDNGVVAGRALTGRAERPDARVRAVVAEPRMGRDGSSRRVEPNHAGEDCRCNAAGADGPRLRDWPGL